MTAEIFKSCSELIEILEGESNQLSKTEEELNSAEEITEEMQETIDRIGNKLNTIEDAVTYVNLVIEAYQE